jgi:CheY-like chemotaxis protein
MSRILVVEDNPRNSRLVRAALGAPDREILEARTAEEGLHLARTAHPDLILLDIQLPGMDGCAVARALKEGPETRHAPIVALTALAMNGDRERVLSAGCDRYLAKPASPAEIRRVVEGLLPASARSRMSA